MTPVGRICEGTRDPATVLREQIEAYKNVFEEAMRQVRDHRPWLSCAGEAGGQPSCAGLSDGDGGRGVMVSSELDNVPIIHDLVFVFCSVSLQLS